MSKSGLDDFVSTFKQKAPKKLTQSARDKAIVHALQYVPAGLLDDEKAAAGVHKIELLEQQPPLFANHEANYIAKGNSLVCDNEWKPLKTDSENGAVASNHKEIMQIENKSSDGPDGHSSSCDNKPLKRHEKKSQAKTTPKGSVGASSATS